jgi:hypothetical protein
MKLVTLLLSRIRGAWQGRFGLVCSTEAARARWTSSDWARVRAPVRHRDLALSEKDLVAQPVARQHSTTELSQRFSRIANRSRR